MESQTTNTQTKPKRTYQVAILTPYLTDSLKDVQGYFENNPSEVFTQIDRFGYDPENLNGNDTIQTPKSNLVQLITKNNHDRHFGSPDLVIAGSTEAAENEVESFKGSGLIVARYSIFYSEPSGYTGRHPHQAGYSLDIFKDVNIVKALLKSDEVLEAIASREEPAIRSALDNLNQTLPAPILVTPYLAQALEDGKGRFR